MPRRGTGCSVYHTTPDTSQVRQTRVILCVSLGDHRFTRVFIRKLLIDHPDPCRLCYVCFDACTPDALQRFDPRFLCSLNNLWLLGSLVFLVGGFSLVNKYGKCCGVAVLFCPFPSSPRFTKLIFWCRNPANADSTRCRRGPPPVRRPYRHPKVPLHRSVRDWNSTPPLGIASGNLLLARWCLIHHYSRPREHHGAWCRERIRPGRRRRVNTRSEGRSCYGAPKNGCWCETSCLPYGLPLHTLAFVSSETSIVHVFGGRCAPVV